MIEPGKDDILSEKHSSNSNNDNVMCTTNNTDQTAPFPSSKNGDSDGSNKDFFSEEHGASKSTGAITGALHDSASDAETDKKKSNISEDTTNIMNDDEGGRTTTSTTSIPNVHHSDVAQGRRRWPSRPFNTSRYSYCDMFCQFCVQCFDQFNCLRQVAGTFVNNKDVQFFIIMLIGINGIMMGIGTFDFIRDNEIADNAFETVDKIFLIIFTVELGLQFLYHGWRVFLDGWLVFDFVIITVSWSFSSVQIVRAFRIFRALRLITRIKVMKNLILALFSVIPRMFAIGLLLFLVSYIFAVMFTQLFKNLYEEGHTEYDFFGRIDNTFFTLFQIMTLDNWADIARQVMAVYAWAWLPFITFVIITGFVVVNLIIAVICDAVAALEDEERAKLHGTYEANISEESQHPALQEDVREQLDVLETYVDELASMQEQTMRSLQILTKQLAAHKLAKIKQVQMEHEDEEGSFSSSGFSHEVRN